MSFFCSSRTCEDVKNSIKAKKTNFIGEIETGTTVITGANSGLGKVLAQQIALLGGHVILACRSSHKAYKAISEIEYAQFHLENTCCTSVVFLLIIC